MKNFWIFEEQGKIMEAEKPTVRVGTTPSELTAPPPPKSPSFLHRMPFLPQPSQFFLAWDRQRFILACIPVAWAVDQKQQKSLKR